MLTLDLYVSQLLFNLGSILPHTLVIFLASYLIWLVVLIVIFRSRAQTKKVLLQALLAVGFSYALNFIIGFFLFRERPFISLAIEPLIQVAHLGRSFPSDHAAVAATLAMIVFLHDKKSGMLLLVLALIVALSRVLAGVHFVSDVVVGSVVGIGVALLLHHWTRRTLFIF
jgi:undecaprenyl-diphosphatase